LARQVHCATQILAFAETTTANVCPTARADLDPMPRSVSLLTTVERFVRPGFKAEIRQGQPIFKQIAQTRIAPGTSVSPAALHAVSSGPDLDHEQYQRTRPPPAENPSENLRAPPIRRHHPRPPDHPQLHLDRSQTRHQHHDRPTRSNHRPPVDATHPCKHVNAYTLRTHERSGLTA
jgi:hypothetical protein